MPIDNARRSPKKVTRGDVAGQFENALDITEVERDNFPVGAGKFANRSEEQLRVSQTFSPKLVSCAGPAAAGCGLQKRGHRLYLRLDLHIDVV
ncbi:hypothetical protein ACFDR9_002802 [Janthinobacterium sp. CG_23.3]|uniref:hypothetical protein n=1 Tax=Janthinobacterium sp. CG_23.3 TaxID=3349634 RepID=UPI0038D4EAC1